jgi:endogenous inhibitor of DNA gyrase (YacG/DUF329 family)
MSSANCDWCGEYVEVSNHRFPGYCSPDCRDADRVHRDAIASDLAQRRRDARQHRAATDRIKRHNRTNY